MAHVVEPPTPTGLNPNWTERFLGGSAEAEDRLLRLFAEEIQEVQRRNRRRPEDPIRRAFHAKLVAGVVNARFVVSADVRPELRVGLFVPGASYPAIVRFSNASGIVRSDAVRDLRGVAVRVVVGDALQDLLFSNTRTSHSRDAVQFMASAVSMAGGRRIRAIPGLIRRLGLREGLRVFRTLRRAASHRASSPATESYFGRVPFAVGPYAVKFALLPQALETTTTNGEAPVPRTQDGLRQEFLDRHRRQDVRFRLEALHFVDEATTPIEDATVEWTGAVIEPDVLGELVIPRQDLTEGTGPDGERSVEAMEFTPWNTTEGIRPIGSLNRARKPVYEASAGLRAGRS